MIAGCLRRANPAAAPAPRRAAPRRAHGRRHQLGYLDLADSTGMNRNENFARELLKLHTVGMDGGYTEAEIKQAAGPPPQPGRGRGPVAAREFSECVAFHPSTVTPATIG